MGYSGSYLNQIYIYDLKEMKWEKLQVNGPMPEGTKNKNK